MNQILHDVRYGLRTLRKSPGFAAVVVLTLGLAIGANTAIFTVVNAVLLRPLPYDEAERLVLIYEKRPRENLPRNVVSPADFLDWRAQSSRFEGMAAFDYPGLTYSGGSEPLRVQGAIVSPGFFETLGVKPKLGRGFSLEHENQGKHFVTVLSHGFWQRHLNSDPTAVGKTITLNDNPFTVVGVMPPGFNPPGREVELFVPLAFSADERNNRGNHYLFVAARLKQGVSMAQASAEMDAIGGRLEKEHPVFNRGHGPNVVPMKDGLVSDVQPAILFLLGAVGFVLLVACANVSSLLLARATVRRREITVCLALGAGRVRLARQLFTESVLLAVMGGAIGLFLAIWGVAMLSPLIPTGVAYLAAPGMDNLDVDLRVLAFTAALSLLSVVVFGLAPMWHTGRGDLNEALNERAASTGGGIGRQRTRRLLVVSEVALSFILLAGAALLLRSFRQLQQVSPGFRSEKLLTMRVDLSSRKYRDNSQILAFYTQALERLRMLPGAEAAATSHLPISGQDSRMGFQIENRLPNPDEPRRAHWRIVSPGYFETMRIPVVRGRTFTDSDGERAPLAMVITDTTARLHFGEEDPIGKRVRMAFLRDWAVVVGVVGSVRHWGLDEGPRPEAFVSGLQRPFGGINFVIRTRNDPTALVATVRNEIRAVDPEIAITGVRTMEEVIQGSMSLRRFYTVLLTSFAALAVLLAMAGVYALMAYWVAQRTREIGVRVALGASRADVMRLVVGRAAILVAIGLGVGVAGSLALTRTIERFLYHVKSTDPMALAAGALVLGMAGLLASYIPARRAAKVDPMVALRYE